MNESCGWAIAQGGVFGPEYLRCGLSFFKLKQPLEMYSKYLNAANVRACAKSRTQEQLLTMDVLVLATMKNAAKCDT